LAPLHFCQTESRLVLSDMAGAIMTSSRILLLLVPVAAVLRQSPAQPVPAADVVGQFKQLKEALQAPKNTSQTATAPTGQAVPELKNRLTALFDHLKNTTEASTKKEEVAKPEEKAAVAVVAPKPAEKAAVKVDVKPVATPQVAPKAGFACECAPGAACPEVCTMGVKGNNSSAPAPPVSASSVSNATAAVAPVATGFSAKGMDEPAPAANWTSFADQVAGFAHVHPGSFVHAGVQVRGIAASKDLMKGEQVLEVPLGMTLSAESPELKRFFGSVNVKDPDKTWRLVSFLAAEKRLGDKSPWAMYFQHLPSTDDFKNGHPLWGEKALLEKFVPIPLLHEVYTYQKMFKEDMYVWKRFAKAVNAKPAMFVDEKGITQHTRLLRQVVPSITKDDLFWAFTVVLTRGFESPHGTTLAPLADDFNTDLATSLNARWHAKPDGSLEIVATHPVKSGEELLINYASKPTDNEKFTSVWGFTLANNNVAVSRLAFEDCQALEDRLVWKAKKTALRTGYVAATQKLGACVAPASEKQPGIYCNLLALAKEHCPYVKDFQ